MAQMIYVVMRIRPDGTAYNVAAFLTRAKAEYHIQKMVRHNPDGEFEIEEMEMGD